VVDDLIRERREGELGVDHVLLGDALLAPVLHHRVEEPEDAALQDVGRGQIARVAQLQDEGEDVGADPVHLLREAHGLLLTALVTRPGSPQGPGLAARSAARPPGSGKNR
jgi:hypothetical protein